MRKFFFLFFCGCTSVNIISNKNIDNIDFQQLKNSSITIYSSNLYVSLKKKGETKKDKNKEILRLIREYFNKSIPTIRIEDGKIPLPGFYQGKFSSDPKKELNTFLEKQTTDYVFILSESNMSHTTKETVYNPGSQGIPPSSYNIDFTKNEMEVMVRLWSTKDLKIVLDYKVHLKGSDNLKLAIDKAVEFIQKSGKM